MLLVGVFHAHAELRWDDECGISPYPDAGHDQDIALDIVNGWDARPGEFPWTAGLNWLGSHFCGAVILSEHWLLTAAHCVSGSASLFTVAVGQHVMGDGTILPITKYIQHEHYNQLGELENDVALIYVEDGLPLGENVMPACKPSGDYGGAYASASGWGHTSQGGQPSQILQYTNNPTPFQPDCEACFGPGWILDGMLCWGFCGENARNTCNGDSGGPLMTKRGETFDFFGTTSWNLGGCVSEFPKVFSNISYFTSWVDENAIPFP